MLINVHIPLIKKLVKPTYFSYLLVITTHNIIHGSSNLSSYIYMNCMCASKKKKLTTWKGFSMLALSAVHCIHTFFFLAHGHVTRSNLMSEKVIWMVDKKKMFYKLTDWLIRIWRHISNQYLHQNSKDYLNCSVNINLKVLT